MTAPRYGLPRRFSVVLLGLVTLSLLAGPALIGSRANAAERSPLGWLTVRVADRNGRPVEAIVIVQGTSNQTGRTNSQGLYRALVPSGTYIVSAIYGGISTSARRVTVAAGRTRTVSFALSVSTSTATRQPGTTTSIVGGSRSPTANGSQTQRGGIVAPPSNSGRLSGDVDTSGYSLASRGNKIHKIKSLKADPTATPTNGSSQVTAVVENPSGSTLSYSWNASGGKISGQTAQATWTAPATAGTYTVTLTVTDLKNRSARASVSVQAVASSSSPAKIAGQVTDTFGAALSGASVKGTGPQSWSVTSDTGGNYSSPDLPAGSYSVTASLNGYSPLTQTVNAVSGSTVTLNFALTQTSTTGQVGGRVTDAGTGSGIQGASVSGSGPQNWNVTTDSSGYYTSPLVPTGTYLVTATKSGYDPSTKSMSVAAGTVAQADFRILQSNSGEGGRDPAFWPFATGSSWNYPIGSDAQYAQVVTSAGSGVRGGAANIDQYTVPTYVAASSDPVRNIYDISTGSRVLKATVRVPSSARPSPGTDGHLNIIDDTHTYVHELYHAQIDSNGDLTTWKYNKNDLRLNGAGFSSWHGSVAAGTSAAGGMIRKTEFSMGTGGLKTGIRHALQGVFYGPTFNRYAPGGRSFVWPASSSDNPSSYGTVGNVFMGSLLAIPSWVDVNALGITDPQVLEIARALQHYGVYIIDAGNIGSNNVVIRIDSQASGEIVSRSRFDSQIAIPMRYLQVVTNSHLNGYAPAVPGGGGTPLSPLAPALAAGVPSQSILASYAPVDLTVPGSAPFIALSMCLSLARLGRRRSAPRIHGGLSNTAGYRSPTGDP
jgi:hypothetical protein